MFGLIYAVFLFTLFLIGLCADLFAARAAARMMLSEARETRESRNAWHARRAAARAASYASHASRAAARIPREEIWKNRRARDWATMARCWATVARGVCQSTDPKARQWARKAAKKAQAAYMEAKRAGEIG